MIKCTMFFSVGPAGWSETLFRDGTSLATAVSKTLALVTFRRGILCDSIRVSYIRVSDVDNQSIVDTRTVDLPGMLTQARDYTNAALYAKIFTASGAKRFLIMRGIPDAVVTGNLYTPPGYFATPYVAYAGQLVSDSWCLRAQNRAANPIRDLASIGATGHLTMFAAQTWARGDKVKFFRTRDTLNKAVTGTWQILDPVSDTEFPLNGWTAGRLVVKGRVRRYALIPDPITFVDGSPRPFTRKTGRPFGSPRGRVRVTR